jgi:hypothetical protein
MEPKREHISKVTSMEELNKMPGEDELRYLGNAQFYCNYFMGTLKKCTDEGSEEKEQHMYKRCKEHMEGLHHCYSWREPTEEQPSFMAETGAKCLLPRDIFVKCMFR